MLEKSKKQLNKDMKHLHEESRSIEALKRESFQVRSQLKKVISDVKKKPT